MISWKIIKATGFILLSLVFFGLIKTNNRELFIFINQWSQSNYAILFSYITLLGDGAFIMFALAVYTARPSRFLSTDGPFFIQGILIFLVSGAIVQILKHILLVPRPAAVLNPTEIIILGKALYSYSFPSGHSASLLGLVTLLNIYWNKNPNMRVFVLALWSIAWLGALSRVLVGAHWPLDIFFGAWIGYSTAHIIYQSRSKWEELWSHWQKNPNCERNFILLLRLLGLIALFALILPL